MILKYSREIKYCIANQSLTGVVLGREQNSFHFGWKHLEYEGSLGLLECYCDQLYREKHNTVGLFKTRSQMHICILCRLCMFLLYTRSLDQMGPKGIHLNEPLGMCLDIFPTLKLPATACMPFNPCDEMHQGSG